MEQKSEQHGFKAGRTEVGDDEQTRRWSIKINQKFTMIGIAKYVLTFFGGFS